MMLKVVTTRSSAVTA